MAKTDNLKDFLTDVADAIRTKKGTTAKINPQDFSAEIASIETGGGIQQRVLYLRRSRSGYIDTGIDGANSDLAIEIQYAMQTWPTGYTSILHAYKGEAYNATRILLSKSQTVLGALNSLASSSLSLARSGSTGVVYTDKLEPTANGFKLTSSSGSSSKERVEGEPLGDVTLKIFPTSTDVVVMDLYKAIIKDDDEIVRYYIPYYKDGEYGLYDTITKQFYGNDGSGEFTGEMVEL